MKIRKYFSIKDNENLAYSNLWDAANYVGMMCYNVYNIF